MTVKTGRHPGGPGRGHLPGRSARISSCASPRPTSTSSAALDGLEAKSGLPGGNFPAARSGQQALRGRPDRHHRRAGSPKRLAIPPPPRSLRRSELWPPAGDQLSEITGQKYDALNKPGDDMPLNTPQPANEDEWVTVSLDRNVSLLSSRLAADIARENVKIAFGGHLPTLDVIASKSRTTQDQTESLPSLGPPFSRTRRSTTANTRCRSPCRCSAVD